MPSLIDKPRLMEKLKNFHNYVRKNNGHIGTKQRGIDLNFNNACNLRCEYCFTNSPKGDHVKDTLETLCTALYIVDFEINFRSIDYLHKVSNLKTVTYCVSY